MLLQQYYASLSSFNHVTQFIKNNTQPTIISRAGFINGCSKRALVDAENEQ